MSLPSNEKPRYDEYDSSIRSRQSALIGHFPTNRFELNILLRLHRWEPSSLAEGWVTLLNVLFESVETSEESVAPTLRSKLGCIDSIPVQIMLFVRTGLGEKREEKCAD